MSFVACRDPSRRSHERARSSAGATLAAPTTSEGHTTDTVDSLVLDLLEWIGPGSRPYAEVIDAWRTSCPRLPVWEEATARGFVDGERDPVAGTVVRVSVAGRAHLLAHRPRPDDVPDLRATAGGAQ